MVNRKLFRPALTDMKEPPQFQARATPVAAVPQQMARKKPAPPNRRMRRIFTM